MRREERLQHLLDGLASDEPAPGGGSAAAAAVAMSAALLEKVARVSSIQAALDKAHRLRRRAEELIDEDAGAYLEYVEARRTENDLAAAQARIVDVPLETARIALELVELGHELGSRVKPALRADATTAAILAHAAISALALMIQTNVGLNVRDPRMREALELTRRASQSVRGSGRASVRGAERVRNGRTGRGEVKPG